MVLVSVIIELEALIQRHQLGGTTLEAFGGTNLEPIRMITGDFPWKKEKMP